MTTEIDTLPDNVTLGALLARSRTRRRSRAHGSVGGRLFDRYGNWVAFHSSLERDFALLMIMRADVLRIIDQPVTIRFRVAGGAVRGYTPDYLVVVRRSRPVLAEIHPVRRMTERDRLRYVAATSWCKTHDCRHEVWTDRDIYTHEFANASLLAPYRVHRVEPSVRREILGQCRPGEHVRLARLLASGRDMATDGSPLFTMLATHELEFDWDEPLTPGSLVYIPLEGDDTTVERHYGQR